MNNPLKLLPVLLPEGFEASRWPLKEIDSASRLELLARFRA
jgi:hypothetical protein